MTKKKETVRLVNVIKNYYSGPLEVPVLKDISFVIEQGQFVGIMGASGSGKSTMLNILGLLDVPTSGNYILEGQAIEKLSPNELARLRNKTIGFVFQSFNLLSHLNVEQNIEVPMVYGEVPLKARKKAARELADRVGLGHRLSHRPNQLSGGECQRIAIARSLSNNPAFLLADEPTGNLDEKTGADIIKLFHELNDAGMTIVMVTHNPAMEAHFDAIMRLRDGKLCEHSHVIFGSDN